MTRQRLLHDVAASIAALRIGHPVRVALDGVDAAGKTTFADELAEVVRSPGRQVIRACADDFPNPAAVRYRLGRMSPEGYYHDSFDHRGLIEHLLQPLGPGGSLVYRRAIRDIRTDEPVHSPVETALPDAVLLMDGVFLLRPELREHWEFSIFIHADFDRTLARALVRDVGRLGDAQHVRQRYEQRYIPGQRLYLQHAQPQRAASVVIDNNNPQRPVLLKPA